MKKLLQYYYYYQELADFPLVTAVWPLADHLLWLDQQQFRPFQRHWPKLKPALVEVVVVVVVMEAAKAAAAHRLAKL